MGSIYIKRSGLSGRMSSHLNDFLTKFFWYLWSGMPEIWINQENKILDTEHHMTNPDLAHMTWELTDCFLTMLVKAPALAVLESENILELSPRIPMLSQGWISGVLRKSYKVLMRLSLSYDGLKLLNQGLMPIQSEFCNPCYHGRDGWKAERWQWPDHVRMANVGWKIARNGDGRSC